MSVSQQKTTKDLPCCLLADSNVRLPTENDQGPALLSTADKWSLLLGRQAKKSKATGSCSSVEEDEGGLD
jgi:hypothetical protein